MAWPSRMCADQWTAGCEIDRQGGAPEKAFGGDQCASRARAPHPTDNPGSDLRVSLSASSPRTLSGSMQERDLCEQKSKSLHRLGSPGSCGQSLRRSPRRHGNVRDAREGRSEAAPGPFVTSVHRHRRRILSTRECRCLSGTRRKAPAGSPCHPSSSDRAAFP